MTKPRFDLIFLLVALLAATAPIKLQTHPRAAARAGQNAIFVPPETGLANIEGESYQAKLAKAKSERLWLPGKL